MNLCVFAGGGQYDSCFLMQLTACEPDPVIQEALEITGKDYTMLDFYNDFWKPFGELLTDMEEEGFLVNRYGSSRFVEAPLWLHNLVQLLTPSSVEGAKNTLDRPCYPDPLISFSPVMK